VTHDPEALKVECTLAIARCLEADPLLCDPWGLACAMFFAGVDVQAAEPRALAMVDAELLQVRERTGYQVKQPRRAPNFAGEPHAKHRRPESTPDAPARRKSDAEDAVALAADLEAEAGRARDRDRARRAAADQHSGQ
jgi:hypothetical protein